MSDLIALYGLTALPAALSSTQPITTSPSPVHISTLQPPTTPLALRIDADVRSQLSLDTYRHSLRVYTYGLAIARECFPSWHLTPGSTLEETWFLTAMLHDIGTTDANLTGTMLSYEFFAGVHALQLLQQPGVDHGGVLGAGSAAPKAQAESVAEAIIRHQDVQESGMVTLMTRLIHLGTLLDNVGANVDLVHRKTVEGVVGAYPRHGWSGCFRDTVVKEKRLKPWAMVSRIDGFEEAIMANRVTGGQE